MSSAAYAKGNSKQSGLFTLFSGRSRRWLVVGLCLGLGLLAIGVWRAASSPTAPRDAPEADKVFAAQANMPFQILIPAYLPANFDRAGVSIDINEKGAGGEPITQLTYRTGGGARIVVREWVPVNPDLETLAGSRIIQTKWGKGWLLTQQNLAVAWVDVGPLRVALYSTDLEVVSRDRLAQIADTLGPPSDQQVFTFVVDRPIKDVAPPPPFEVKQNEQGVQELTLIITPGGYSPLRFAVQKGVPVRVIFKQLGAVGCGNELLLSTGPDVKLGARLASESDKQILEFTPQETGQFEFHCAHYMYRGIMTVHE